MEGVLGRGPWAGVFDDFLVFGGEGGGSESGVSIESMKCPPLLCLHSRSRWAFSRQLQKSACFPLPASKVVERQGIWLAARLFDQGRKHYSFGWDLLWELRRPCNCRGGLQVVERQGIWLADSLKYRGAEALFLWVGWRSIRTKA